MLEKENVRKSTRVIPKVCWLPQKCEAVHWIDDWLLWECCQWADYSAASALNVRRQLFDPVDCNWSSIRKTHFIWVIGFVSAKRLLWLCLQERSLARLFKIIKRVSSNSRDFNCLGLMPRRVDCLRIRTKALTLSHHYLLLNMNVKDVQLVKIENQNIDSYCEQLIIFWQQFQTYNNLP